MYVDVDKNVDASASISFLSILTFEKSGCLLLFDVSISIFDLTLINFSGWCSDFLFDFLISIMPKKGQIVLQEETVPLGQPLVGDKNIVGNIVSDLPIPPGPQNPVPTSSEEIPNEEEEEALKNSRLEEIFNALSLEPKDEETNTSGDVIPEKFYITTAINYTNGDPHMGHAYEAISADVIARYHRLYGRDVFFLTGTDEHGQKIANRAETEGVKPIDICDKYANGFIELNKKLRISNDAYIRTTMPHHYKSAQTLWELCAKGKLMLIVVFYLLYLYFS